jgi:hypothetical protein
MTRQVIRANMIANASEVTAAGFVTSFLGAIDLALSPAARAAARSPRSDRRPMRHSGWPKVMRARAITLQTASNAPTVNVSGVTHGWGTVFAIFP